jgi:hypothetical protein
VKFEKTPLELCLALKIPTHRAGILLFDLQKNLDFEAKTNVSHKEVLSSPTGRIFARAGQSMFEL